MGANAEFVRAHRALFPRLTPAAIQAGASQFLQGDWPEDCLALLARYSAPHGNVWTPDTCLGAVQGRGCVIHYFFEHDAPQGSRTHTCVFVERACAAHQALPPGHGLTRDSNAGHTTASGSVWEAVHEENQRKNGAEALALQTLTAHVQADANGASSWLPGVTFAWAFDATRSLTVRVTGGPAVLQHGPTLAALYSQSFGGRVALGA